MSNVKSYVKAGVLGILVLFFSTQALASGSGTLDNDMLRELKRMIEQQQAQIDKQAAEIAALQEQLSGNSEAIAVKADIQGINLYNRPQ